MDELKTNVPESAGGHVAGRLWIVLAAVMWSSSGLFAKLPIFDVWGPYERGPLLAFWRAVFAGMLLLPWVRRPRWTPALVPMTASFAGMNVTFLSAMVLSTAANAIWLQSTSPMWVFLLGLALHRTTINRLDAVQLIFGTLGVGLILAFEIRGDAPLGVACGLFAGICYAGVVISISQLRDHDLVWLVALNHLTAAALMLPVVVYLGVWPTMNQLAVLACFGLVQMGLPYLFFARGLRTVGRQEAAGIALLEPLITPVWAYLTIGERPASWTLGGGALILVGLALRYLGGRYVAAHRQQEQSGS